MKKVSELKVELVELVEKEVVLERVSREMKKLGCLEVDKLVKGKLVEIRGEIRRVGCELEKLLGEGVG